MKYLPLFLVFLTSVTISTFELLAMGISGWLLYALPLWKAAIAVALGLLSTYVMIDAFSKLQIQLNKHITRKLQNDS
jgi:hypothetical protein